MFGEAIDCKWSGNSDLSNQEIACYDKTMSPYARSDHGSEDKNTDPDPNPDSTPEIIYNTNDSQVAISMSEEQALNNLEYDPNLSTDLSHDIEFTMEVNSTPQSCRLPSSITGKEIWSCTDLNSANSVCSVSCPAGYKLSNSVSSMTCGCDDSSSLDPSDPSNDDEYGDIDILNLGFPCQWDNKKSIGHCVIDEDYDGDETDLEVDADDNYCIGLQAPQNGNLACTNGFKEGTTCLSKCDNEPYEFLYPGKAGRRKCRCHHKKGCYWTKPKISNGSCQPAPSDFQQTCSAVPTKETSSLNDYTTITCDDSNNHGSKCQFKCAKDFTAKHHNSHGIRSRCHCSRKRGIYSCDWTKELENRICVPTDRWFRRWDHRYIKAEKEGADQTILEQMQAEYEEVEQIQSDFEALKLRKRRRRSLRRSQRA